MSFLGNILWILIGGGVFLAIEYFVAGFLLCITIIGIPFGIQCMKLTVLSLFPFGKSIHTDPKASGCLSTFMNIIWIFVGGIWISLTHLVFAILCAITIIGLPFAKQHIKLASLALTPFGKNIV